MTETSKEGSISGNEMSPERLDVMVGEMLKIATQLGRDSYKEEKGDKYENIPVKQMELDLNGYTFFVHAKLDDDIPSTSITIMNKPGAQLSIRLKEGGGYDATFISAERDKNGFPENRRISLVECGPKIKILLKILEEEKKKQANGDTSRRLAEF